MTDMHCLNTLGCLGTRYLVGKQARPIAIDVGSAIFSAPTGKVSAGRPVYRRTRFLPYAGRSESRFQSETSHFIPRRLKQS